MTAKPDARSHRLADLLREVPPDIQHQLETAFTASELQSEASTFAELLEKFEGLFVASRYPFEPSRSLETYSLPILLGLVHFIHQFVSQLTYRDLVYT